MSKPYLIKVVTVFILMFCGASLSAQQLNYTLNRDYLWGFDNYYNNKEENTQTFIKPYTFETVKLIKDSSAPFPRLLVGTKAEEHDKEAKSQVEVYPLLSAHGGYDLSSPSRLTSDLAIGGHLLGYFGNKFAFSLKIIGGNQVFNSWQDSIVEQAKVIPGIGRAYRSNSDTFLTRYGYQYYSGYVSWSPNKIFNIQAGQDKHFWGDGYRSLFLSDVSAPYPFLKITTNVWHLTYVNLYTIMKDMNNPSGLKKDHLTKYATFHYLGWNATKRLNIGLFESIVWQGSDSTRHRGYDVNYLNPIMFFRPAEYSLGSSDNAFLGLSFKLKLFKHQQLYGQLLLDEFLLKEVVADSGWWGNKQAFQLGFKSFDLFTIKRLNFQYEFNYVRPYTYAHGSVQQNYSNMNEPLAHPLGANFIESATFLNYRYKRLFIEAKFMYAFYGADSGGTDYGRNIFISYSNRPREYGNFTGQGFQTRLITASLRAAYILDTRMNLKIELGVADRIIQTEFTSKQTPYIFLGIRTDLSNLYNDY
ncbi:MAG: hypothetical protein K0Q95_299 [Bacteroidota bacterium]|jgi:hypothetical protein|nr:hypothetical protein [Bacteroidota bacterium]